MVGSDGWVGWLGRIGKRYMHKYMDILYHKSISYNEFLTPTQTSAAPSFKINDVGYNFYTLIMYDPDAVGGTYWHWILTNIDLHNKSEGENIVFDYQGPNPPDTKIHRYIFELYGTNEKIDVDDAKFVSRNVSLGEGKEILNIKVNPILFTQFLSHREMEPKGGRCGQKSKSKSTKKTKKTKKTKNRIRRSRTRKRRTQKKNSYY